MIPFIASSRDCPSDSQPIDEGMYNDLLKAAGSSAQTVVYCADDSQAWIHRFGFQFPAGYRQTLQEEYDAWVARVKSPQYCVRLTGQP
jgi:hypothetical protein